MPEEITTPELDMFQELLWNVTEKLDSAANLKYKDENWGQLQYYGTECPVQWPCALVDISNGQFTNNGIDRNQEPRNRQQGTVNIELTIGNLKITNTSRKAPTAQRFNGWTIWKLVNEVHKVLQGYRPLKNSGGLVRTSMQKITRDDAVQEVKVIYTLGLSDC